jgi:hypothetical protein
MMAKFQVLVTMIVEADDDSEAWSMTEAVLDNLVWPGSIEAAEVDEVSPDRRGRLQLTDLDNTLD